jgi:hypothetical protein
MTKNLSEEQRFWNKIELTLRSFSPIIFSTEKKKQFLGRRNILE